MSKSVTPFRLFLLVLLLVAITACHTSTDKDSTIPSFTQTELDRHIGQVVVLNFWATWCSPCRTEMPALQSVYETYQDRGLVVLGVNVGEGSAEIARFADKQNLTFPMFTDPDQEFTKAYNIHSLPTTLLINTSGGVVTRHIGAVTRSFLEGEIEPLLH